MKKWHFLKLDKEIYDIFIKGYTEKQWGRKATELPASIIRRIPIRFTFDNNYFFDNYQGIPINGYTDIIKKLIKDIEIITDVDYFSNSSYFNSLANCLVFTGRIDEYYKYVYGHLEYRSLNFKTETLDIKNYQGNAVVNYTDIDVPYTRIIEHKHFNFGNQERTVITKEYPLEGSREKEPFYPINTEINNEIYRRYKGLAFKENNVIFDGRLAEYKYYDMHQVIASALSRVRKEFGTNNLDELWSEVI